MKDIQCIKIWKWVYQNEVNENGLAIFKKDSSSAVVCSCFKIKDKTFLFMHSLMLFILVSLYLLHATYYKRKSAVCVLHVAYTPKGYVSCNKQCHRERSTGHSFSFSGLYNKKFFFKLLGYIAAHSSFKYFWEMIILPYFTMSLLWIPQSVSHCIINCI